MDKRVWPAVLLGGLTLAALAASWWVFSPDTTPGPVEPVADNPAAEQAVRAASRSARSVPQGEQVMSRRERMRRQRGRAEGEGRGAKAPARPERGSAERVLEPDELVWARTEFRDQRLDDMDVRLDEYAAQHGWDADVTEEVRSIMVDTIETITEHLTGVDLGEQEWDDMKRDMRDYRETQANRVEALLGEDDFGTFIEAMGFTRFAGEAPIDGRVRMRRRQRRGANVP